LIKLRGAVECDPNGWSPVQGSAKHKLRYFILSRTCLHQVRISCNKLYNILTCLNVVDLL